MDKVIVLASGGLDSTLCMVKLGGTYRGVLL